MQRWGRALIGLSALLLLGCSSLPVLPDPSPEHPMQACVGNPLGHETASGIYLPQRVLVVGVYNDEQYWVLYPGEPRPVPWPKDDVHFMCKTGAGVTR